MAWATNSLMPVGGMTFSWWIRLGLIHETMPGSYLLIFDIVAFYPLHALHYPASTTLPHIAGALDLAFFRSRTSEGCCSSVTLFMLRWHGKASRNKTQVLKKKDLFIYIYMYIYRAPPPGPPPTQKKKCQNESKDAKSSYNLYIYKYICILM